MNNLNRQIDSGFDNPNLDPNNPFAHAWQTLEQNGPKPRYARNIHIVEFEEFKDRIENATPESALEIAAGLYTGDCYILKNAYNPELLKKIRTNAIKFADQRESEFHKMFDGAPNFHRLIDADAAKHYYADARRHIFYFFPWNNDDLDAFEEIYSRWSIMKMLGGCGADTYRNNIPSDGVVDRFHVFHYPSGGGSLETHGDPTRNQKTIMAGMMSKRGKDYEQGGFYFVKEGDVAVDCEPQLDPGDLVSCYSTVLHGVAPVDPHKDFTWDYDQGRWFVGLYSVESDYIKERETIQGLGQAFPDEFVSINDVV